MIDDQLAATIELRIRQHAPDLDDDVVAELVDVIRQHDDTLRSHDRVLRRFLPPSSAEFRVGAAAYDQERSN